MDGVRDQFLPGAALPLDEHCSGAGRHLANEIQRLDQHRSRADDLSAPLQLVDASLEAAVAKLKQVMATSQEAVQSQIQQAKARGGTVIAVATDGDETVHFVLVQLAKRLAVGFARRTPGAGAPHRIRRRDGAS